MELKDNIAESLERLGLWRRAARRWLVVMEQTRSDEEREFLVRRRDAVCYAREFVK